MNDDVTPTEADASAVAELRSIRQSIDNIDAAVIHMLAERFKYTQRVGHLKAESGMPAADPDRERIQVARLRSLAAETTTRVQPLTVLPASTSTTPRIAPIARNRL